MTGVELAILGCGNMGLAVLRGALAKGVLRADQVLGIDPAPEARANAEALGIRTSAVPTDARGAARLMLAVKPQSFAALAEAIAPLPPDAEVISIMGGWTSDRIAARLPLADGGASGDPAPRVVRAMPNLPATIGAGVTAIAQPGPPRTSGADVTAAGAGAGSVSASSSHGADAPRTGSLVEFAVSLFRAVGEVVFVPESMMDAVTALSGSGPAYAFLLAESMLDAARRLGFDEPTARTLVMRTLEGSVALMRQDPRDPEHLRAAVTSRGGTTEAAVRVWVERGVPDSIAAAVLAAALRAGELGRSD